MGIALGSRFGRYRIDGFLGRGGMGTVFRATDVELDRPVAIKVLAADVAEDRPFRERFVREARLLAALDHPSVVPIYEAGEIDGLLFMAMRYVPGRDLGRIIRAEAPLDPIRSFRLLGRIALALDAAHHLDLIHRDVKPANILVSTDAAGREDAVLADFGLSRRVGSGTGVTSGGGLAGTVGFMAPEQLSGMTLDGRVDQYALACVAYACLTGHLPFESDQDAAVLFAHAHAPPPDLASERADLPAALSAALARALAKDRDERYPTCWDLVVAASGALGVDAHALVGVESRGPGAPPRQQDGAAVRGHDRANARRIVAREWARRRSVGAVAAVAATGLVVAMLVVAGGGLDGRPPIDAGAVGPGGQIVFVGGSGRDSELYSVRPDGSQLRRLTDNTWLEASPAISRDGGSIAYAAVRQGNRDIYVMDPDRSGPRRLTLATEPDDEPAWSWDAPAVAFTRGGPGSDLYLIDDAFAEGSLTARSERITTGPATDMGATWSPDGPAIAMSSDRSGRSAILRLVPETEDWLAVTSGDTDDRFPAWSPDGAWIAFMRDAQPGRHLYRVRPDGSGLERLTDDATDRGSPSWSPDGGHLLYAESSEGRSTLVALDISSRTTHRLDVGVDVISDPDWGPDVDAGR